MVMGMTLRGWQFHDKSAGGNTLRLRFGHKCVFTVIVWSEFAYHSFSYIRAMVLQI